MAVPFSRNFEGVEAVARKIGCLFNEMTDPNKMILCVCLCVCVCVCGRSCCCNKYSYKVL